MTRINLSRNNAIAWESRSNATKDTRTIANSALGNLNALAFAAVLVVCAIAVGCSSDQPKPVSSNSQISMNSQPSFTPAPTPAPVAPPASKPAVKKSAPKKPATVNYTDKANGVTFEYPRRYAIETGDAASELVLTNPVPMNFVAPGGVALAAVELPETGFDNTDFSSAFFNVSVHKTLTPEQCTEFAVPFVEKQDVARAPSPANADNAKPADQVTEAKSENADTTKPSESTADAKSDVKAEAKVETSAAPSTETPTSVDLKELTLHATEAVSGQGTRQSDSRYFHVYQNGSCYEFALNVSTNANGDGLTKHIDRDRIFARLEKILDTVKLESPALAPEVKTADAKPDATAPTSTPAQ